MAINGYIAQALPSQIFIEFVCLSFLLCSELCAQSSLIPNSISIESSDRILILAPHPDDEVIACGGIIQKAMHVRAQVATVFLTYGDNNEWSFLLYRKHPVLTPAGVEAMGEVRHNEAITADKCLGLSTNQLFFLGYPDFGTLHIWQEHWGTSEPARSMLTKVTSVPYKDAFRPGAPYMGEEIIKDLITIINNFKPTKIFVSHPADHNPDHRALYLFTTVALWNLADRIHPDIYPYLVHFRNWPRPKGFFPDTSFDPPHAIRDDIEWKSSVLNDEEIQTKNKAIRLHKSQFEYSSHYLLSFIRQNELFGDYLNSGRKSSKPLLTENTRLLGEMPDELIEEEKARFVGIEERTIKFDDRETTLSIKFSKPFGRTVSLSMYAFGYRPDIPFEKMPKLHILFTAIEHHIFDQSRKLDPRSFKVRRSNHEIEVIIPRETLGSPTKIMTSANTHMADVPLDWVSWRILTLEP